MSDSLGHNQGYAVEMLHISKTFGALKALDDVSIQVKYGEVHAILGENGAGKSTLMSILFGLKHADSGKIRVDNQDVKIKSPLDANKYGIGMVHQHFKLVEVFSLLDNIMLGHENSKFGFVQKKKERERVQTILNTYGLDLDLNAKAKDVPVASQQKAEIAKVLFLNANIIILDEPTAVLTPQEIENLMKIIRKFASEGKAVLLITHKLNEIKEVADTVTVLRRGRTLGTFKVADCSPSQLAQLMVGKKVNFEIEKKDQVPGNVVLDVEHLSCLKKDRSKLALNDVSFQVHEKEVVAIAAIEGNGQEELLNLITGLDNYPKTKGKVTMIGLDPKTKLNKQYDFLNSNIKNKIKAGMGNIPSDRLKYGLILDYSIENNLVSRSLHSPFVKAGFLNKKAIDEHAKFLSEKFDIRSSAGITTRTGDMSGGNQQKVIIARELDRNPRLVVSDQATRGLDVGAIEFVNKQIIQARDSGAAVLLYSTELEDIFNLATVIYVMHEGKIVAKLDPKKTTYQEIGLYMGGGNNSKEADITGNIAENKNSTVFIETHSYSINKTLDLMSQGKSMKEAKNVLFNEAERLKKHDITTICKFGIPTFAQAEDVAFCLRNDAKEINKRSLEEGKKARLETHKETTYSDEVSKISIEEAIRQDEEKNKLLANNAFQNSLEASSNKPAEVDNSEKLQNVSNPLKSKKKNSSNNLKTKDRSPFNLKTFINKHTGIISFLDSIVAIVIGLFLGFLVMLIIKPSSAFAGFGYFFSSAFENFGYTLWLAGPLILLGLCVAIPNKAGLFNIGASGQFTFAAMICFMVANYIPNPGSYLFWLLLLVGMIAGMFYGSIVGLLKAYMNVNEVLSSIMLNWVAVYFVNLFVKDDKIYNVSKEAANYAVTGANVPIWGLDKIFGARSRIDIGIFVALIVAVVFFFIVNKTRYGFKLKAAGISRSASKYAGYSEKRIIISSLAIGGLLAGLASVFFFFPKVPQGYLTESRAVLNNGFDGISVSLIGNSSPLGIIFSGLFISGLRQASSNVQIVGYDKNLVDIIMGVTIYSTAAIKLVSMLWRNYNIKKAREADEIKGRSLKA